VTNKSVAPGDYIQVGQTLMALVPPRVWVTANFKETQLRDMRPGQSAIISIDAYRGLKLRGHVDSIQAGSGAAFSLLPPENATGNYVKVVQRVPVKIVFDQQSNSQHVLGPGMSVAPDVQVANGFGPAIKVIAGAVLLIAIVIIGAVLWIRKVRE
jgi:membrane fusion protein (multidrug efflux system)